MDLCPEYPLSLLYSYVWYSCHNVSANHSSLPLGDCTKNTYKMVIKMCLSSYAPNFGKAEGAYCLWLVRVCVGGCVSVCVCVCLSVHPLQNLLRYSFEISYMDSSKNN